ncbi:MAG: hypothetical protein GKS07_07225 [Nitrosopumilus sp.]|nr:MAG: hypothetical protein GKS07_07225 [Nitrosopumilus sp.]
MSSENSKTAPIAILGILIATAIVVIAVISIQGIIDETVTPMQPRNSQHGDTLSDKNANPYLSSESYSGPFAILNDSYGVDDTVFFIGSDISLESKGGILFVRPDGEIHHVLHFDGSQQAVNHYFTPVSSSDLKECPDCEFFGTWEIVFRAAKGNFYSPMYFEVEDDR